MFKLIFSSIVFCLVTTSSFAYLGPGVGGGVIAATIGIIVAIFAVVHLSELFTLIITMYFYLLLFAYIS